MPSTRVSVQLYAVTFIFLTICLSACHQRPAALPPPERLAAALKTVAGGSLAQELEIEACKGRTDGRWSCAGCSIEVLRPRLDDVADAAIIRVACSGQYIALAAFRREPQGDWRWLGTASLVDRYGDLVVEFKSLVRPPLEDVVIRNQEVDSGTGLFLGSLWVMRIVDGRLRVVFSTGDTARMTWSTPDPPPPGEGDYFQKVDLGSGAAIDRRGTIRVTTEYEVPAGRFRLVREYKWSEKWQVFLPVPPDKVALLGG